MELLWIGGTPAVFVVFLIVAILSQLIQTRTISINLKTIILCGIASICWPAMVLALPLYGLVKLVQRILAR